MSSPTPIPIDKTSASTSNSKFENFGFYTVYLLVFSLYFPGLLTMTLTIVTVTVRNCNNIA